MRTRQVNAACLEREVAAVADSLRALGNERRLVIMCNLLEWREANVGTLAGAVGLSQSALSQHLAKLRRKSLISFRRDSRTLWYRVADPRVATLLAKLQHLFAGRPAKPRRKHLNCQQ
jgi:DNA-binding transcriptional ArsR family regulator